MGWSVSTVGAVAVGGGHDAEPVVAEVAEAVGEAADRSRYFFFRLACR